MRAKLAALAVAVALAALPGCEEINCWGPTDQDKEFSAVREAWERPLGLFVLPVGFALDATVSIAFDLVIVVADPINWVLIAAHAQPIGPAIWLTPGTSTGLTLLNPYANLDWSWAHPKLVYVDWGDGFK
jgi:hypothetical protein